MRILFIAGLVLLGSQAVGENRILTCQEKCQYFDSFSDQCLYETSCLLQGDSLTYTSCDRWDSFNDTCVSETEATTCHSPNPFLPPPACTAKCQYFDSFQNTCLYRTQCLYTADQRCVTHTSCDRWDNFNERCLTEVRRITCH